MSPANFSCDTVNGRSLTTEEIVSSLRNWTTGDLGSLATSVGVIVHFLAKTPTLQQEIRALVAAGDRAALVAAVEEIPRIDDPFVSNRRVTNARGQPSVATTSRKARTSS